MWLGDQRSQPDPQGGGLLAEVEVHRGSPRKPDTNVSRVRLPAMQPVPASIARVLDRALAADPDREALVTRTRRLTYAELDRRGRPGRPRAARPRRAAPATGWRRRCPTTPTWWSPSTAPCGSAPCGWA